MNWVFMPPGKSRNYLWFKLRTTYSAESVYMLLWATRYITLSNCCLSLYLNIAGLSESPGKRSPGSWNLFKRDLECWIN